MITLFPAACDDELDFSIFARHCVRKPYSSKRAFVEELFGRSSIIATVGLPSNIAHFIGELAPGHHYSIDGFINQHTLFPYYALFLEPDQAARLRQDMCLDNGPGIHMRAGLMASKMPLPSFLKLCPACVELDRQQEGFCYWHRKHQPFGVEVCATHNLPLLHTHVPTSNRRTRYEFVTAEEALKELRPLSESTSQPFQDVFLALARSVAWSLDRLGWSPGLKFIRERYLLLLEQRSLTTAYKHVRMQDLYAVFQATYVKDLQHQLRCVLDEASEDTWLARLVRKPKHAQHPLYHLLLMNLFGHTAESFFTFRPDPKTFGDGPWPCLNPVCEKHHQMVIDACKARTSRYTGDLPVGIFACSYCGFAYARTWTAETMDLMQRQRIVEVGPVWEAWLCARWNDEGYSLRGLARELGVDPNSVKDHACRLGLPFPRPGGTAPVRQLDPQRNDDSKSRPTQSSSQALRELSAAGHGIIRTGVSSKIKAIGQERVDWIERDTKIAAQIPLAAEALRGMPGRPRQITITSIGRHLGLLALLQRHLNKMPLTHVALEDVVETRVSWALRRIEYIVHQDRQDNLPLRQWQLIRKAGVERLLREPAIQVALAQAMVATCE